MVWLERLLRWVTFNLWYLKRPPWDTQVSPPELIAFIQTHPPGRALDLGCGSGTNLLTLAKAGWQVAGVDLSLLAVWRARQRLRRAGMKGEVLSGSVIDLSRLSPSFNLILDIGCYHGLPQEDRERYRKNLLKFLAPAGTFLLYAHLKEVDQSMNTGITRQEIEIFNNLFTPVRIQECQDRWERLTIWLEYNR
ncbi:class I SAM-dependent methyltransferase [Anaerolinea thermophila]|uniref:class I SAM-dependent methyltransferase n=2 Tax=Anaerolinea TaxID=233189 RepID=UPI0026F050D1|nr:class I SAM-dependent methyltransferase [Anaerolinea thermophila]